jgi:hypothetical protein
MNRRFRIGLDPLSRNEFGGGWVRYPPVASSSLCTAVDVRLDDPSLCVGLAVVNGDRRTLMGATNYLGRL